MTVLYKECQVEDELCVGELILICFLLLHMFGFGFVFSPAASPPVFLQGLLRTLLFNVLQKFLPSLA